MRQFIKNKISIIIPTYNEKLNIIDLLNDIMNQLKKNDFEIIVVDDGSTDQTVESILSNFNNNKNLKLIQRQIDRGLLQSIKFALQTITGEKFLVMDGDGQHSANDIGCLIKELEHSDLVIGSRKLDTISNLSKKRIFFSRLSNLFLKKFLNVEIIDPLTGLFAGRVSLLNKKFFLLKNSGFKVLLDLIFANKYNKITITEKIINFNSRKTGVSKLGPQVIFSFITQILSFFFNGIISSNFIGFIIIGGFGFLIHLSIFFLLLNIFHLSFMISHICSVLFTSSINFLLNNYLNFYQSNINSFRVIFISLIKYYIINLPGILTNIFASSIAYNMFLRSELFSSIIGVLFDTIFKYFTSKTWIWKNF